MDLKDFNTTTMKEKLHLTEHTILYEGIDERDNQGDPFLLTIIYKHSENQSIYIVQIEADMDSWYECTEIYLSPTALDALQRKGVTTTPSRAGGSVPPF